MQGQQPGEQRQGKRGWKQQEQALALLQNQPWQVAANDLGNGSNGKQATQAQQFHG